MHNELEFKLGDRVTLDIEFSTTPRGTGGTIIISVIRSAKQILTVIFDTGEVYINFGWAFVLEKDYDPHAYPF